MTGPRVLHVIRDLSIGGAQRSVATLSKTPGVDSRVAVYSDVTRKDIQQADCVVAHVWRTEQGNPYVPVPPLPGADSSRTIIFNHDIEGRIDAPGALLVVYSAAAAGRQQAELPVAVLPGGIAGDRLRSIALARKWERVETMGRLSTLHGGKIAPRTVAWWADLPFSRLLVGGGGTQMEELISECRDARYEFPGPIAPNERNDFLSQIDIFCYQTEWHEESFGYVVLEAMAAGCVVVTEARGALGEIVADGTTGVIIAGYKDAAARIAALLRNPTRCSAISLAGSQSAMQYTNVLMQRRFRDLVTRIVLS